MKKILLSFSLLMTLLMLLPSCGEIEVWTPEPPGGWYDTFYDRNLDGCWQLYQVNSQYVRGDEVNYMDFYGDGRGMYYYYDRGYPETERFAYWCQQSVGSTLQMNIQYEYDRPSTMNYWFSDPNTLWMQWSNSYGVQTYVYKYVNRVPW